MEGAGGCRGGFHVEDENLMSTDHVPHCEAQTEAKQGEHQMKPNVLLTIASLLSILLSTFHMSDDIVRGIEKGGLSNLIAVPILVIWLYGTLVLAGRRS